MRSLKKDRCAVPILAICILILTTASITTAAPLSGIYKDGELVDRLSPSGSLPLAAPATSSPTNLDLSALTGGPPVSAEARQRNSVLTIAALRAETLRQRLRQMASLPGRVMVSAELQETIERYLTAEQDMRATLEETGLRLRQLGLADEVQARHAQTVAAFEADAAELRDALEALWRNDEGAVPRALEIMQRFLVQHDPPLLSSELPYQNHVETAPHVTREDPASPAQSLVASLPSPPTAADLAATIDIQLTAEIASQAAGLENDPVAIYEFVRNTVEFQPYLGSRKGAAETLRQRRGNDTDQASLLMALLRASSIPCRYVRGTIEIDAEQAKSWLAVDNPLTAANLLVTAGLNGVAVFSGGNVVAVRLTHVWVEAFVPYGNYRGVPNDASGMIWVPLDPSFKSSSVVLGSDVLGAMGFNADAYLSNYLSTFHDPSPIEKLVSDMQSFLDANDPGKTVAEVERRAALIPESLGLLPGSLPYTVRTTAARVSEIEDSMRYKIRFHLYDGNSNTDFIDHTLTLPEFAGRRVTIQYVGATAADQDTINAFGGIYSTPPNLVNVKPLLKVDNVPVAVSANSIGMGRFHNSDMQFLQPTGDSNSKPLVQNPIIAGDSQAVGFDTFLDVDNSVTESSSFPASAFYESILHDTARDYLSRVDRGQEQTQRLLGIVTTQDVSEVIAQGAVAVFFSGTTPVVFDWKGLVVDADRRIIGPVAVDGDSSKLRPYMILTGMDGSTMENRVFEDRFAQRAVSTIKILELASDQPIPLCTITTSIAADCPGFSHPAFIASAVSFAIAVSHVVTIPRDPITFGSWSGTGYIDMQPSTGAAAYIIAGVLSSAIEAAAGGSTVDEWPINLPCEATNVSGQTLVPAADSPDPSAVFCADDSTITFKVRLTITCQGGSTQMQDMTLVTHKTKKQIGPGNYDLQLVAFGTTTIRKITIIGVEILSADVRTDAIEVRLSPDGFSGPLRLRLLTPNTHQIRNDPRSSGMYTETFDIPNLGIGEYKQVQGQWTVGNLTCKGERDYHIRVLGTYRHSRYNIPHEMDCSGAPAKAYITTASCNAFSPTTLRSNFISQVNLNGSGVSISHGNLGREFSCAASAFSCLCPAHNPPADASGISFRSGAIFTGKCNGASLPLNGSTVAALASHPFLTCNDQVFIHTVGVKTVTDRCPGCSQMQLDNFTTAGDCTGITDLGNFMTIKLFP